MGKAEPEIRKHLNGCAHEQYVFEEFEGIRERTLQLQDHDTFAVSGTDLVIEALHTPGHKTDHMGYLFKTHSQTILFPGDAILGSPSTSCDDMTQYWKDLDMYMQLQADKCYIVHTQQVTADLIVLDAGNKIEAYIEYNKKREAGYVAYLTAHCPVQEEEAFLKLYCRLDFTGKPMLRALCFANFTSQMAKLKQDNLVTVGEDRSISLK